MKRASLIALAGLLVACGQQHGIHERFVAQYAQTVAGASDAHGESAKTRTSQGPRRVRLKRVTITGGRQTLNVPSPAAGPNGTIVVTWPQWGALFLDRLGAPRCANNLIVVVAWAAQEGTDAGWNPLATTLDMPGATLFNSAGVRNYVSLEQGLDASVLTLRNGLHTHGYGAIVADLRACADPIVTAAAINASDWCAGCAGGAYVIGVLPGVIAAYESSARSS